MREMDPLGWFGQREVNPIPIHFTKVSTPYNRESHDWVLATLKGRYGRVNHTDTSVFDLGSDMYFCFEDPKEAMLFELRWSG